MLGHESARGRRAQTATASARGDLVTATVRRSCRHCLACAEGAPDSCLTGDYVERGITRLDGFARELVAEDPAQLIPIPATLGRLGVLAEPTSICERALRHARTIGGRQPWQLAARARLGAGAIGVLSTYLLRLAGSRCWTASLEPRRSELVDRLAARATSRPPTPPLADAARGARRLRPRRLERVRRRAADGRQPRAPAPQRRRLPARHRRPPAVGRRRRAGARARRDPREPRPLRERQRSPRGLALGGRLTRPRTGAAGRRRSRSSSACACRSTASRRRSPTAASRRHSSSTTRGLMWNCVPVGMAQTKQVVRVGRRA